MRFLFQQLLLTLFVIFVFLYLFTNMNFWIREAFLFFGFLLSLLLLSMIWPPDSPWSPWWKTSKKVARALFVLAKLKKGDTVYELGSGDGEAVITLGKEFGVKCLGIEIDPLRVLQSQIRVKLNRVSKTVTIVKKNFFAVPLADADLVYLYLVPKALERLKEKLLTELKPGTPVASYRYPIPYLPLIKEDKKHELFLYQIPLQKKSIKSTAKK